jgi:DNA-binding MarR family transcriptional regulator
MKTSQTKEATEAVEQMYSHPGFLLRRAHQIAAAIFEQESEGVLTPPQFSTLTLVSLLPGIDMMTVGRIIGLDRTTVAVVITNLIKQGWLNRTSDPEDGRRYRLDLTDQGRAISAKLRAHAEASELRLLSAFTPSQAKTFVQLLRKFVDNFNEDSRAPVDETALPQAQLRRRRHSN